MKTQLRKTLENSRLYTLAVAEAMPEKYYESKPAEPVWTFCELMHHIAYGIAWWDENYIRKTETEWAPPPVKKNKKEITGYLNQSYDRLENSLKQLSQDEEKIRGFQATLDHITHHRGQATTYLRTKGIEPPAYIY